MIPGIQLSNEQEEQLNSKFASWSGQFRRNLIEEGFPSICAEYESLICSVETQSCQHSIDGIRKTGSDWSHCCGISYEYMNDIAVRTAIELIIDTVSQIEKERLRSLVNPLDSRLLKLLNANPKIFREEELSGEPQSKFWWPYKLPLTIIE